MFERQLSIGTAVVLKKPYETNGMAFSQGRIHSHIGKSPSGKDRYAIVFEGYGNQHGLNQVDFNRDEFILALSE
jgi:hypothetical protein